MELLLLEKAGEIRNIQCQPVFPIIVNGIKVGKAIMDFVYEDIKTGKPIVEDVKGKGIDTTISRFKRKCAEALYGIKVRIL